jgi:pectate lyase
VPTTPSPTPTVSPDGRIFPGAQGFGVDSPAGRGGRIIKVTNLNTSGAGSFRAALEAAGPRIIVFEVGGIIDLNTARLTLSEPFVTIAGQTAPSPGITLIRGGFEIRTHDVLLKHIRFRIGDAGQPAGSGFEPDVTTNGPQAFNIVIDHCSFSWGVDENMSVSGPRFDGPSGTSRRVTLSNNIIAEGLYDSIHSKGIHSMGTLIHDYVTDVAVLGNLYAHNNERNPWFKGFATGVIVNNLVYNPGRWPMRLGPVLIDWSGSGITPEPPRVSVVGNYMRHGVNTPSGMGMLGTNSVGTAYVEDNIALDRAGNPLPITFGGVQLLSSRPSWPTGLVARPASAVIDFVTNHAGARPRDRDSVDARIVAEVLAGTGSFIDSQEQVGGYPRASMTTRPLEVPTTNIDAWLHSFSLALE